MHLGLLDLNEVGELIMFLRLYSSRKRQILPQVTSVLKWPSRAKFSYLLLYYSGLIVAQFCQKRQLTDCELPTDLEAGVININIKKKNGL